MLLFNYLNLGKKHFFNCHELIIPQFCKKKFGLLSDKIDIHYSTKKLRTAQFVLFKRHFCSKV